METYGCREFMLVAAQCDERSHLHLTSEQLVTEIVDDDGRPVPAGRAGGLVVTDLYNVGAPLIRYDMGDLAVASAGRCPCGRGLPLLAEIIGRSLETIVTPDRRLVPGEVFPMVFTDVTAIARYQGIQDAPDRLLIRVQLRADWPVDARRAALGDLQKVLGDKIRVDLEVVDALEEMPVGKLQVVRNPWLARQRQLEHQEGGARA